MAFLFKCFEKLVLWRVEETALTQNPLHPRQFAFRKNMSTENALSESINLIESNVFRERFVIAIYLDIRGAFDNISTRAIIRSLKNKGVENTVLNWYEDYLENRTCEATLGGSKCISKLNRGTPQGGCGSPVLGWDCPYDDLLRSFDNTAIEPFGFADDSKLIIPGIDFDTCFGLAQSALRMAEKWARDSGVSFCPNKTAVLFFSRGNWKPTRQLCLDGKLLKWSNQTKYLGITIDRKLSFHSHMQNKIAMAKKKLMILRHVFDQTWGPHPKITRWAYTGIVRPALTYGSIVWACKTKSAKMQAEFKKLQRLALIQVAKVRPSTPTTALEIIYNVPPLDLLIWEIAQKTAVRIGVDPKWVPQNTRGHQHLILESLPLLSRQCLDDVKKTLVWEMNYYVEIGDGKDIICRPDWSCYTDGSLIDGLAGAGSVILKGEREFCMHSYALGRRQVFQAEISAIINTVNNLLSQKVESERIYFMVDSQAALKSLQNPESKSKCVQETKEVLNRLGRKNYVVLRWIRGHQKRWNYNHQADLVAREGAAPTCQRNGPHLLLSKRAAFAGIENVTLQTWTNRWINGPDARQTKFFFQGPSKSKAEKILWHSREIVSRSIRFLTGHAFMRRQNAVVFHGISPPPGDISCRLCEDFTMDETPHHLITECEALIFWRMSIFGTDFLEEYPRWHVGELIKFLTNKNIILLECD